MQRFYVGRWQSGLLWMFTGGLFLIGWIIDAWLINDFVEEYNAILFQREFDALTAADGAALDPGDYMLSGGTHDSGIFPVAGFYYPQDAAPGDDRPAAVKGAGGGAGFGGYYEA